MSFRREFHGQNIAMKTFSNPKMKQLRHPVVKQKLSFDSLTTKANHLKEKLSQRSSYLTDGFSKHDYSPLHTKTNRKKENIPPEIPYSGSSRRRKSYPVTQSVIDNSSVIITEEDQGPVPNEERTRRKTVPVIYGDILLPKNKGSLLRRTLRTYSSINFIVGTIIGSGIFLSPSPIMRDSGSIGLSLIVWTICGLVAFLGALCYIELGTEIQRSGSEYSYLLNGFGKLPAFIYSWGSALVIRPTVTAKVFCHD